MTTPRDPDERVAVGLRALYDGRQAMPTAELRARIADVPTSRLPLALGWLRVPLTGAAVIAVAIVGVLITGRLPGFLDRPGAGPVGAVPPSYDPAHPTAGLVALSGVTFDGIGQVMLWIGAIVLSFVVVFVVFLPAWRDLTGQGSARAPRTRRRITWRQILINGVIGLAVLNLHPIVARRFERVLEPGSASASGLGVTESRNDGIDPGLVQLEPDLLDRGFLPPFGPGAFDGPHPVYAVVPGQSLTYVMSVRNTWPIGIRLLGRWVESRAPIDATEPSGSTPTGLSLLRDANVLDPTAAGTKPFEPVDLAPGEEVTLVVAEVARDCADPTTSVPVRERSGSGLSTTIPRLQFVIESFGIEGIATVALYPEVTVPSNCPREPT